VIAHDAYAMMMRGMSDGEYQGRMVNISMAETPAAQAIALYNRGVDLQSRGRYEEAITSYDRAIELQSDLFSAHLNRANALQIMKRYGEALAGYERALDLRSDSAVAFSNRGSVFQALQRYLEALTSYDQAIALKPDFAEAHHNRGTILLKLKRFEESLASSDRAIALKPDHAHAYLNRGNALGCLKRFGEAIASYERAGAVRPDYGDARYNEAVGRLLLGEFDRGWKLYEWRWQSSELGHTKRNIAHPLWLGGTEIAGKTILLHAEQGLGDTIQFCRYVPIVAKRGARVVLWVPNTLHELMSSLSPQVISTAPPSFDVHCPLLSLPLAFGTRPETIPAATPYLHAPAKLISDWAERLKSARWPRIGLAWSGRPTHPNDHNRSIPLRALSPLFEMDASFVSLQKDIRSSDADVLQGSTVLLHFGDELKDFADTAALVSNLDLVISVDTSVAHLAGALGKPVWVLLPNLPDWRWLLDRADSPWYPTARLFRQDDAGLWDEVIVRIHAALHDFMRGRRNAEEYGDRALAE
jgi:Tfp pilus assembly protein PilF